MKLKSVLVILLVCLVVTSFISVLDQDSYTYATSNGSLKISSVDQSNVLSPRSEQTVWKYRTVDDKVQKRLWSKTYNKWLTDWEWV
ncbi:hypothetical protein [Aminipila sp.]|uniref:hypothetical protein n=1 Tax=Aminipila sp. TaxID=2060095 RepID=UPI00289C3B55|nr:hypothetical protein [Aminipila sp.]